MKKIFYYFPEKDTFMYKWQRVHFFDELARHDVFIDSFNPLLYKSWDEANENALKKVRDGAYNLFMADTASEKVLYLDTLRDIKRIGLPTLSMRSDNLLIPFEDKCLARHFDLIWLSSIETKYLYDKWNANSVFAPYASSPFAFFYNRKPLKRKVCFIGNPYGSRSGMINVLSSHGIDVSFYHGNNNFKENSEAERFNICIDVPQLSRSQSLINYLKFKEGRIVLLGAIKNKLIGCKEIERNKHIESNFSVPFSELNNLYSEYVLSLASTSARNTDVLDNPLKVINLRNFEIPMSGGIEICRYNAELASYFEDGKEIVFYNTKDELVDKAYYYTNKASDSEIYKMKEAARKRAENEHTWYHRFSKVLGELNIKI